MDTVVFRLCDKAPDILREVCLERGWEEYNEDECEANGDWNLWWKTQGFTSSEFENCRPWQRLNHFPKSTYITKKDGLARNLRRMKTSYGGSIFEFFPRTFILPNEYKKFVAEFSKQNGDQRSNYWICKPTEQSCGRGIFIFKDLHDLTYDCAVVVQKYVIKPYLISGYKFDLRLYAIVTSFHPFRLYIYHEGIVRFSTERFDLSTLDNRYSHLTNTSINKTGPQYSTEKESIGVGCKWTLSQLRVYLCKHNIDDRMLWHRITSLIIITLLSQVQDIPSDSCNCFEMFGFDVLIDEKMKPWLLEVNFSPALGNDCTQDELVKRPLLNDILEILSFTDADIKRGRKEKLATRKRGLKARDAVCDFPKKDGRSQGTNTGLGNKKTVGKNSKPKSSVFGAIGDKTKMPSQRCKTPGFKCNLSLHKRLSTSSEEFVKAPHNDHDGQTESDAEKEDWKATKIPLDCTSKADDALLAENNQSLCLERGEVENGHRADFSEGDVKTTSQQKMTQSHASTRSSVEFSRPVHKSNGLPSRLRLRRYNTEVSSLNSVDKHITPHSSTGNLHHLHSKYFARASTAIQRTNKKASVTLKPQIGNCILAFPFNEVTHKSSQRTLDQKVVIEEIRKILRTTSSHIKSLPSQPNEDGSSSQDLSKPFWGYRSKLNTFYSSLLPWND